jgi:hypothetical protein
MDYEQNNETGGHVTMSGRSFETTKAFNELLQLLGGLDSRFLVGDRAVQDDQSILEGYKWIFSILHVAFDAYVWADRDRPRFVDIVGPYKKWGGDNADAFYQYAPIDPTRTYLVRGRKGDAVYLSLSVYGGPDDGRYSERIVGTINDRDMQIAKDGTFEIVLSPNRHDGSWIRLESDAVCAITRDYMNDVTTGHRAEWRIESVDPPATCRLDDADLARRFRAAATWVRQQAEIAPIPLGEPNAFDDPYPVPATTFGWAAGDASYAMGSFDLEDNEALIIDGRSPECAFWNLSLWNQFLHCYNYDYERVTINGSQTVYNDDRSWTLVVAHRDPGHPNWISTQGHRRGRIWARWFLPVETPAPLKTRVVKLGDTRLTW